MSGSESSLLRSAYGILKVAGDGATAMNASLLVLGAFQKSDLRFQTEGSTLENRPPCVVGA